MAGDLPQNPQPFDPLPAPAELSQTTAGVDATADALLKRELSLNVVKQSVSEITRELALHLCPEFRWGYPASAALTNRYVSLDTRNKPTSVNTILDQVCTATGLNWKCKRHGAIHHPSRAE